MMRIFGWLKRFFLLLCLIFFSFQWWESSDDWNDRHADKIFDHVSSFPMMRIFGWLKRQWTKYVIPYIGLSNDENLRMTETNRNTLLQRLFRLLSNDENLRMTETISLIANLTSHNGFPMMRIFGWLKLIFNLKSFQLPHLSNDENLRMTETMECYQKYGDWHLLSNDENLRMTETISSEKIHFMLGTFQWWESSDDWNNNTEHIR